MEADENPNPNHYPYTKPTPNPNPHQVDLIEDLASLPENNAISKINEIARRCRLVQVRVRVRVRIARRCRLVQVRVRVRVRVRIARRCRLVQAHAPTPAAHCRVPARPLTQPQP